MLSTRRVINCLSTLTKRGNLSFCWQILRQLDGQTLFSRVRVAIFFSLVILIIDLGLEILHPLRSFALKSNLRSFPTTDPRPLTSTATTTTSGDVSIKSVDWKIVCRVSGLTPRNSTYSDYTVISRIIYQVNERASKLRRHPAMMMMMVMAVAFVNNVQFTATRAFVLVRRH